MNTMSRAAVVVGVDVVFHPYGVFVEYVNGHQLVWQAGRYLCGVSIRSLYDAETLREVCW